MLELKKVTTASDREKAHICLPCWGCWPWPCWPYPCDPYWTEPIP